MMRADQYEKLQALQEKLVDVFLMEADSDNWPGANLTSANMDQQTRGDRYWSKKNAVATGGLIQRVSNLTMKIEMANAQPGGGGADEINDAESDLDKQVAAAEKEGKRLLDKVQRKAKAAL